MSDDLELPDGRSGPRAGPGLTTRDVHDNFAQHYRLKESQTAHLGQSLFWHDPVDFSNYDDIDFEPKFDITSADLEDYPDADRICSNSQVNQANVKLCRDSNKGAQGG